MLRICTPTPLCLKVLPQAIRQLLQYRKFSFRETASNCRVHMSSASRFCCAHPQSIHSSLLKNKTPVKLSSQCHELERWCRFAHTASHIAKPTSNGTIFCTCALGTGNRKRESNAVQDGVLGSIVITNCQRNPIKLILQQHDNDNTEDDDNVMKSGVGPCAGAEPTC